MCFYGYNVGKQIFCDADAYDPENLKLVQIGCAGAPRQRPCRDAGLRCLGRRLRVACVYTVAGAVSAVFTTPIQAPQELLKCTLQVLKLLRRGLLI